VVEGVSSAGGELGSAAYPDLSSLDVTLMSEWGSLTKPPIAVSLALISPPAYEDAISPK
jgi:hypothetical protein